MTAELNPGGGDPAPPRDRRWRRRIITIAIILVAAAIVQWHRNIGLAVLGRWHHWRTGAIGVDVETARAWVRSGDLLVDVREPEEFRVSHLAGAISVPMEELRENGLPAGSFRDRRVILYCTIGRRSGDASKRLNDADISAYNLVGGILQAANDAPEWIDTGGNGQRLHVWSDDYRWLAPPEFSATTFSVGGD